MVLEQMALYTALFENFCPFNSILIMMEKIRRHIFSMNIHCFNWPNLRIVNLDKDVAYLNIP